MTEKTRRSFNLNKVDLNLLKVFDLLMQERSVTRAADRAGRTQSAISHSLNRLREIFGDELFVKQANSMNPTARARELAPVVGQSLSELQSVIDTHMRFDPAESRRKFRIGVTDYTGALYLPALIEAFNRQAPHARLTIVPVTLYDAGELLVTFDLDCLLIGNPIVRAPNVVETVLARHEMLCAAWRGNSALDDLSLERYLEMPHLQISPDGDERGVSDKALADMGLTRRVAAVVPYYLVAAKVLKGTAMIAAIADGMLLLLDQGSEIRAVRPPLRLPEVKVSLIYASSKRADAAHTWLRGCIRGVVSAFEDRKKHLLREVGKGIR